uniref:ANAPC4_WD40 domain-containing protein n=1 Tax=Angiostrongylus cantonensis TaxID=6313 RepID=A0A0K0DN98_ANGCA
MKLQFLSTLLPQQEGSNKICSLTSSPNGIKLAVVGRDRIITLIDEKGEVKDRFSSKPLDQKYGKKSYIIKSICFSPDSSKLAVAQTDNVVYVLKIGETWNEKKVIVNKLPQTAAATVVEWPFDDKLLVGLADGKLRVGLLSSNKCSSLYKTDEQVVSISVNTFIMLFFLESGVVQQQFDFTSQHEKEFSAITTDITGSNVVLGSFDRLGTLCGGVIAVDCCLRRGMLKSRFETTYVAPSHVIVRDVVTDTRINLVSQKGYAIENLKVCIVVNAGELTIVEYGIDGALGWVRTELTSPHLLSVSVSNDASGTAAVKKIAYLTDPTSIAISMSFYVVISLIIFCYYLLPLSSILY